VNCVFPAAEPQQWLPYIITNKWIETRPRWTHWLALQKLLLPPY